MTTLKRDDLGTPAQVITLGLSQDVAIGAASTQSQPIGPGTTIVRLAGTVDCRIAIGENPTATATSSLLSAGGSESFGVRPGWRVAVIQQSGPGSLSITEAA